MPFVRVAITRNDDCLKQGLANGFPLSGVVSIAVADAFKEEKVLDNVNARCGLYFPI